MKFIRSVALAAVAALTLPCLFSCKTTEANYREAYMKTIAARNEDAALDSTIYGRERRQMQSVTVNTSAGQVEVRRHMVRVTDGGGGFPEKLHRYNVVVGQFKQLFNAKSLRERLVDANFPSAFVVETAEPYYYVVLSSFDDAAEASKALDAFKAKKAISMREPCPFILDATVRRQAPTKHK